MKQPLTVCVDLDGVLAEYDRWRGLHHIGKLIPGARGFMTKLGREFKVVVWTTRCNPEINPQPIEGHGSKQSAKEWSRQLKHRIEAWLFEHKIPYSSVHQGAGKPMAIAYVDDRAVSCRPQSSTAGTLGAYDLALQRVKVIRDQEVR